MPDAGQIASWVWKHSDEIARKLADLYAWFRGQRANATPAEPARGILIIGPGGTGKTTLARLLAGQFDWLLDSPWEYRESLDAERFTLRDDPDVEVVVPPGQQFRSLVTWPDLLRALSAGEFRGVILTTCYGHHSLTTTSYRSHELYAGNKDEFVRTYFADRRADELRVLRQLTPHLRVCPGKVWLLTVACKQDLWAGEQAQVEEHYLRGEFAQEIASVASARGAGQFRHEPVFAALLISNLVTLAGERLRANEAGYDHREQVLSLRRLLEVVAALSEWEGKP